MGLWSKVLENAVFVMECLGLAAALFLVAWGAEKLNNKKNGYTGKILTTKKIAMVGLFSAIAAVLMLFEIPLPFAPGFYKIDFSELPVLIVTFAFGPVVGVLTEFCKIILKLFFRSTTTAFVGELANFVVGCSLILPASFIYLNRKSKKHALIGCITGTLMMTLMGTAFNAIYLLPTFAKLYGMPLDAIIGMGTQVNHAVNSVTTFVIFCVAPLNLLKGGLVSGLTMVLYKQLSPILKADHSLSYGHSGKVSESDT